MMIDECPEEITPHMFDEETREQNAVLRSGFVARAVLNPFMRKSAAGPPRREPPRRELINFGGQWMLVLLKCPGSILLRLASASEAAGPAMCNLVTLRSTVVPTFV